MFDSLFKTVVNVARVVTAPVEIIADVAQAVTKPIADIAQEVVDVIKDETHDHR